MASSGPCRTKRTLSFSHNPVRKGYGKGVGRLCDYRTLVTSWSVVGEVLDHDRWRALFGGYWLIGVPRSCRLLSRVSRRWHAALAAAAVAA